MLLLWLTVLRLRNPLGWLRQMQRPGGLGGWAKMGKMGKLGAGGNATAMRRSGGVGSSRRMKKPQGNCTLQLDPAVPGNLRCYQFFSFPSHRKIGNGKCEHYEQSQAVVYVKWNVKES